MEKRDEMRARLRALSEELGYCGSFLALLHWDTGTFCPPGGQKARARLSGYQAKMAARLNSGSEAMALLDYYSSHEPEDEIDAAILRELRKLHDENERLGMEWRVSFSQLTSIGKSKWLEAREKDDFSIFEPVLRDTFALAREKGRILGTAHPMEAFINDWDRGITVAEIDRLFGDLKAAVLELFSRIRESGRDMDDAILHTPMDKEALRRCGRMAAEALGYNTACGGFFETIHPYAAPIHPTDARICTNYSDFTNGFFSTIHECGHAIYQQYVPEALRYTNLRSGWPGMLHESQSLFYENIVGKSLPFTRWYLPRVQKELPALDGLTAEQMYALVNRVQPGCPTRTSDELTNALRPLMSYELEKRMMDGSLDVHDLPEAWNAASQAYFGVTPGALREGALRSMQWSIGALGFFQSYPLGSIIDGQLRHAMLQEQPDIFANLEQGEFAPVTDWLHQHIHRHQKVRLPLDILRGATGEELSARHYVDYLNQKYAALYGF